MNVVVRPEVAADTIAIHDLLVSCFPTDAEARLVDLLRAANRLTISLVAENAGRIISHVAFSPVTVANGACGLGLAPIATASDFRRQGLAERLIIAGLEACRVADCGWVVVLGEPAYYQRFGFQPAPDFGLSDEYGGGPAFQVVELIAGRLPRDGGLVRYAPEFAIFGA